MARDLPPAMQDDERAALFGGGTAFTFGDAAPVADDNPHDGDAAADAAGGNSDRHDSGAGVPNINLNGGIMGGAAADDAGLAAYDEMLDRHAWDSSSDEDQDDKTASGKKRHTNGGSSGGGVGGSGKARDGTKERNLILWDAAPWTEKFNAVLDFGAFPSDMPAGVERLSLAISGLMMAIILLSCFNVIVASYPEYNDHQMPVGYAVIEVLCVVLFSYDFVMRLITCQNRIAFVLDPLNWIDLIAVAPWYAEQFSAIRAVAELRIVRVLRLVRIFRVLKMVKASKVPGLRAMLAAAQSSVGGLLLFLLVGCVLIMFSATAIFYAERGTRIDAVWYRDCRIGQNCTVEMSPYQSIPDGFWWAINVMSTVGLGDMVPNTASGQFITCITIILGVLTIALPTVILSGNFDAEKQQRILNISWVKLSEHGRQVRRSDLESPRTHMIRRWGWHDDERGGSGGGGSMSALEEEKQIEADAARLAKRLEKMHRASWIALGDATGADGEANKALGIAIAQRRRRRAEQIGRPVGAFAHVGRTYDVMRRQGMDKGVAANPHSYFYGPLLTLARCADGGPTVTILRGKCGMPTLARLTLDLDHPNARAVARNLVTTIDPLGEVACDLGGGIDVVHHAPVAAATEDEQYAWVFRPARVAGLYRNLELPLFFEWTRGETALAQMSNDEISELFLSFVLGSSLLVRCLLPLEPRILRVTIEQHIVRHTRFQRELAAIAQQTPGSPELVAYVSAASAAILLQGISSRLILDPSVAFDHPKAIDAAIVDRILARLRQVKVVAVPAAIKSAIYERSMLEPSDVVYEVPMGFFAQTTAEVEEDAFGYVDAAVSAFSARSYRVDIRMEYDVDPSAITME